MRGSVSSRARRVAASVAVAAMQDVDADPTGRIELLLSSLNHSPIAALAMDADIDTASEICRERAARLKARGYRYLPENEWPAEDAAIVATVTDRLAKRYARFLQNSF